MNFLEAIAVVVTPLLPVVLPGAFFIRIHDFKNLLLSGVRIILWSMGISTLLFTAGLYIRVPVQASALVVALVSLGNIIRHRAQFFSRPTLWHAMAMVVPMTLGLAAFAIPFFLIQDGLPTGDVQKTIIWAGNILTTNQMPEYASSIGLLNRDPVDFYTPGLHAVSAFVLGISPVPLTSIGIFAIVLGLCVAWIAGALTKEMFDNHPHAIPPILAGLFTLTNYRFLRYLREPGYHIQNLAGELFLFGMLFLFIRFIRRREPQDALLFLVSGGALFLTHQFSMFIAVFTLAAAMVAALFEYRTRIIYAMKLYARLSLLAMAILLIALAIGSSLQLGNKVPALFTSTPHLTGLLPEFVEYPKLMGSMWFFTGLAGLILMVIQARRKDEHHRQVIAFASATAVILLLSQGPAIGIDIPPVRALLYLVVPFSVSAGYFFSKLLFFLRHTPHRLPRRIGEVVAVLSIITMCVSSTYSAYASISHAVRTNSTLTGEQLGLIERFPEITGGILVDDYNRRSASWLVLTGRPMFTRIAADLRQQMEEAKQSKLRMELYLAQLDFEKIFSLGSMPDIEYLLQKHSIGAVTGVASSSQTAFEYNPILHPVAVADDMTVYEVSEHEHTCASSSDCMFIMRPATLANDIGDTQDTFEHLPASIRSPRLSEPKETATMTYRETTSSRIPLQFNVGDYTRILWDPNKTGHPETALRFMAVFTKPYQGLSLKTSSGSIIPIPSTSTVRLEIRQEMVGIDDHGFVTLTIVNPQHQRIGIDMIALGPSLIP